MWLYIRQSERMELWLIATLHINEKVCPRYTEREGGKEREGDTLLKRPSGLFDLCSNWDYRKKNYLASFIPVQNMFLETNWKVNHSFAVQPWIHDLSTDSVKWGKELANLFIYFSLEQPWRGAKPHEISPSNLVVHSNTSFKKIVWCLIETEMCWGITFFRSKV